jgi:hypothetical protein
VGHCRFAAEHPWHYAEIQVIVATDTAEMQDILEQHRSFEECLLRELRTTHFGTAVELRFEYIWDDDEADGHLVADEPRPVTLRLESVHEIRFLTALPAGVLAQPERAGWGLTEVALVRLDDSSKLLEAHRAQSERLLHHLVVEWEGDRQLDLIFERLGCSTE